MHKYFQLQYQRTNRMIESFGLPPVIAYILGALAFVALSFLLFQKTDLAGGVYSAFAVSVLFQFSDAQKNDFLKGIFQTQVYRQIRLIENLLLVIPFVLFLVVQQEYWMAVILFLVSMALSFYQSKSVLNFAIPTPFGKRPYEFIQGFRRFFLVFFFIGFLLLMGVWVDNFNLAVSTIGFLFLISLLFYEKPEPTSMVWMFKSKAGDFLRIKIKEGLLNVSILTLPFLIILLFYYPEKYQIIFLIEFLGYIYLSTMIIAKYVDFPNQMSIVPGLLLGLGFVFPPVLPFLIYFFYRKAKRRLEMVL